MRKYTVTELIADIRSRADVEKTLFVTDAEIIKFIDRSNAEMYDAIVSKYENYFVTQGANQAIVAGTEFYDVASDFYKLLGVDWSSDGSSNWFSVRRLNFNERNAYKSPVGITRLHPSIRYNLQNDKIRIANSDGAGGYIRQWYVPACTKITTGTQEINGFGGWEEFIIVDCCGKIRVKQELDPSAFYNEKAAQKQRIIQMAQQYDAGTPETVTDMSIVNMNSTLFPWL